MKASQQVQSLLLISSLCLVGLLPSESSEAEKRKLLIEPGQDSKPDAPKRRLEPQVEAASKTVVRRPKVIKAAEVEAKKYFSEIGVFFDVAGPVQFQTFAQSEVTGEQKYEPNLMSYGLATKFLILNDYIDHGPGLKMRLAKEYSNQITTKRDESSEIMTRTIDLKSFGYGLTYTVRSRFTQDGYFCPILALGLERSDVTLKYSQDLTSFSQASSGMLTSSVLALYAEFGFDLLIGPAAAPGVVGLHVFAPLKSWQSDNASSATEVDLMAGLEHGASRGIGVAVKWGWWI